MPVSVYPWTCSVQAVAYHNVPTWVHIGHVHQSLAERFWNQSNPATEAMYRINAISVYIHEQAEPPPPLLPHFRRHILIDTS